MLFVMGNAPFSAAAYLGRLGLAGEPRVSADGLEALHRAQAYTIPFENFDILLGRGISLEPADVFAKLVARRRGGYCFELNGLLQMALEAFGFAVRPLLARVHLSGTPTGRSHLLLLVTLQGREWLADVGFGGPGLRAPIPFSLHGSVRQDGQEFRLVERAPFGVMLEVRLDSGWQALYSFDLGTVVAADIACGNHFTATHPSSFFTFTRLAALPRADGRVSLVDRVLKTVSGGVERTDTLEGDGRYLDALEQHFGIVLDAPYSALRPLVDRAGDSLPRIPSRNLET
jgi:N-hydroxyarylamine O-acetyltransferase